VRIFQNDGRQSSAIYLQADIATLRLHMKRFLLDATIIMAGALLLAYFLAAQFQRLIFPNRYIGWPTH